VFGVTVVVVADVTVPGRLAISTGEDGVVETPDPG
jgi:hypothetical protein